MQLHGHARRRRSPRPPSACDAQHHIPNPHLVILRLRGSRHHQPRRRQHDCQRDRPRDRHRRLRLLHHRPRQPPQRPNQSGSPPLRRRKAPRLHHRRREQRLPQPPHPPRLSLCRIQLYLPGGRRSAHPAYARTTSIRRLASGASRGRSSHRRRRRCRQSCRTNQAEASRSTTLRLLTRRRTLCIRLQHGRPRLVRTRASSAIWAEFAQSWIHGGEPMATLNGPYPIRRGPTRPGRRRPPPLPPPRRGYSSKRKAMSD